MRTLAINALRLAGKPTGPGRHVEFLAQQWSRMDLPFDRVVMMSASEVHVNDLGKKTEIEFLSFGGRWPKAAWEQFMLPRAAKHASVLFCPTYTCPIRYSGPVVVANHGIYEALPEEFTWFTRLRATPVNRRSAVKADRVIANSLTTKADLIKYFRLPESKVDVIYPAAHDMFFRPYGEEEIKREVVQTLGHDVPYIIFAGKLAKRRNVPNLIKAFAVVRARERLPHHLLIVGPNTIDLPLRAIALEAGVSDLVTHVSYMEQPPLARLYAGADLYVLPTTYEGISQTMFEAMASRTAVLTVDHPTLEEGAGDSAMSVPSPSVEDLTRGMTNLLTNLPLRKRYEEKGRARAKRFSWQETAVRTVAILDRVARRADPSLN